MSTVRKIAKNTGYLFVGDLVSKFALFFLTIAIARYLGDVDLGKYSFAISFVFFFTIIADLGLNSLLVRDIAKNKNETRKYIDNSLSIKLILSIVSFILIIIVINLMNYPSLTKLLVYLFGLSFIFNTFANTFRSIFFAYEEIKYEAWIRGLERGLIFILSLIALLLGYGLTAIALIFLIISILNIVFSFLIYSLKFVKAGFRFDFNFWKFLINNAWPFALADIFWIIYFRIDVVMLSMFKGDAFVGWYSASYQIVEGLMFIPIIFMSVMFPVMARLSTSSMDNLRISVEKSFKYLLIIGLPIAVGTVLLSERFIVLIYGSKFINSVVPLQILMFAIIFIFVVRPLSHTLIAMDKQRLNMIIVLVASLVNLLLNLIFIPKFAHIGAAITTLISEIFLVSAYYFFVSRYFFRIKILRISFKPLIATIIMGFFIYLFSNLNLILIVILSAIIYLLLIFLLKVLDEMDIKFLKEIVNYK